VSFRQSYSKAKEPKKLRRACAWRWAMLRAVLLLAAVLTGCASTPVARRQHLLVIDRKGNPVLADAHGFQDMDDPLYADYLETMIQGMRSYAATNGTANCITTNQTTTGASITTTNHTNRLVLFIHGGLNSPKTGIQRAADLTDKVLKDGAYPVFLSWDSSLRGSYWDHLFWVRRGNADYGYWAPLESPFYLASDIGGAVLKSPIVFLEGFWRARQAMPIRGCQSEAQDNALRASERLEDLYGRDAGRTNSIAVEVGGNRLTRGGNFRQGAYTVINTPMRAVFAPFFHSLGTPAWNVMLRRVDLMFERESDSHRGCGFFVPPQGALPKFARRLTQFFNEERDHGHCWELTLVGHSMGAIVATEFIERAETYDTDFPRVDNIVLLAPAVSQRSFEHAIIPYMKRQSNAVCSILTLEMRGELWERNWHGILPQGSLLVWIDDYFANPNSEADHTLGRFTNLMLAADRIPLDVRGRMNFLAFPFGERELLETPLRHGDFSRTRFWKREFWDVRKQATKQPE